MDKVAINYFLDNLGKDINCEIRIAFVEDREESDGKNC
jgi:hypothetical protein